MRNGAALTETDVEALVNGHESPLHVSSDLSLCAAVIAAGATVCPFDEGTADTGVPPWTILADDGRRRDDEEEDEYDDIDSDDDDDLEEYDDDDDLYEDDLDDDEEEAADDD